MGTSTTGGPATGTTPPVLDAPPPAPPASVEPVAPLRRAVGVARRPGSTSPAARFATTPRYPAMFHVAGGRLVWDGTRLRLARGDGAVVEPAGVPVVTITGDGPTVVVTWRTGHHTTRTVLLDGSSARFARFARSLRAARPAAIVVDDRTVPSPRVPHLSPGRPGTERRPGVFARALWRVVGRNAASTTAHATAGAGSTSGAGGDLVARLERLAALHRAGDLDAAEFARAKALLLR